jgi:hypothetical protein
MSFVLSVKDTDAEPSGEVTSIFMSDTEAIEPLTSSSPLIFSGAREAAAADVVVDAADDALDSVLVAEPHATADRAVIPTMASIG